MILLYPLVAFAAGALILKRRGHREGRGWRWFAVWLAAGGVFTFSFLTGFSIGLFVLPFAAALLLYVAWRSPHVTEALGSVAGVGATLLLIALLSRDYKPCPEGGLYIPPDAPPGTSVECGGSDPTPWFVAGIAVAAAGIVAYAVAWMARQHGRTVPMTTGI
jgi:hypothetical protein